MPQQNALTVYPNLSGLIWFG